VDLAVADHWGARHVFRFRFWINNASRMYLCENTQVGLFAAAAGRGAGAVVASAVVAVAVAVFRCRCWRRNGPSKHGCLSPSKPKPDPKPEPKFNLTQPPRPPHRPPAPPAQALQRRYALGVGDVLMFAKDAQGKMLVAGRRSTKEDVSRKAPQRPAPGYAKRPVARPSPGAGPPARRPTAGAAGSGGGGGKRARLREPDGAAAEGYTYWNGLSLPARVDGVFRAVPPGAGVAGGNRVEAAFSAWGAVVTLGGEAYQAFFESRDAAEAAFEAALQLGVGVAA
jgi:hypothetical protein